MKKSILIVLLMSLTLTLSFLLSPPAFSGDRALDHYAYSLDQPTLVNAHTSFSYEAGPINFSVALMGHVDLSVAEEHRQVLTNFGNRQASSYKQFEANLESPNRASVRASIRLIRPGRSCTTHS